MTILEFNNEFPTEKAAIDYFLSVRYNDTLTCPHCGATVRVYRYRERAKACHCKNCNNSFSPFSDTIFEKSSTDMRKWFYAVHLILNDKKGISGCQLQREIGVTYKTAWRMLRLIREAMGNEDMRKSFDIFVEIDETYVGGKPRKENKKLDKDGNVTPPEDKPKRKRGRGTDKTPVVGVKERGTNRVYAQVALPNEKGQKLTGKQLFDVLDKVCKDDEEVVVATDDLSSYNILDKDEVEGKKNRFVHVSVNHSLGQFSAGRGIHTNNIENFWSLVKRQYIGTHHHYSEKYMQHYIDEMSFRQNNRKNAGAFDTLLAQCVMKRAA
jgi:transposase-like protein